MSNNEYDITVKVNPEINREEVQRELDNIKNAALNNVGINFDRQKITKEIQAISNQIKNTLGSKTINLKLDTENIHKKINDVVSRVRGLNVSVPVFLWADDSRVYDEIGVIERFVEEKPFVLHFYTKDIQAINNQIKNTLGSKTINLKLDSSVIHKKITDIKQHINTLDSKVVNLDIDVNTALSKITGIKNSIEALNSTEVYLGIDTYDAIRAVTEIEEYIQSMTRERVWLDIDTSFIHEKIQEIYDKLDRLKNPDLKIDINKEDILRDINVINNKKLHLKFDDSNIHSKFNNIENRIDRINGSKIKVLTETALDRTSFADLKNEIRNAKDISVKVGSRFDRSEFKEKVRDKINNSKNISVKVGSKLDQESFATNVKAKIEKASADINVRANIIDAVSGESLTVDTRANIVDTVTSDNVIVDAKANVIDTVPGDNVVVDVKANVVGAVPGDSVVVDAKANVIDTVSGNDVVVDAKANIIDTIPGDEVTVDGVINVKGTATGENVVVDGMVDVKGVVPGDDVVVDGIIDIKDTASDERIFVDGIVNVKDIVSEDSPIVDVRADVVDVEQEQSNLPNIKVKATVESVDANDVIYHAGIVSRLNKAETNGRFVGSNRGTGYFGTGHYFVDSATKGELDNNDGYSKKPYTSVDISHYDNLFKATSDEIADRLHEFLRNLTRFTQGIDKFNIDELFGQFKDVFGDTIMDIKEFGSRVDQLKTFMSGSSLDDRSDSVSTQFMKSMGYGGVDTRGTRYADTRYGTVIYDLKEESILQANITDEVQKRGQMLERMDYSAGQVFDRDTDDRIQSELDELAKKKEIQEESSKLYDSSRLDKSYEDFQGAETRLREIDSVISRMQNDIDNADRETRDFARMMASLDLTMSDDEIAEYRERLIKDRQNEIDEFSKEKEELQSKLPVLEEVYQRERELANEAYNKAKQVVEQRRLEAQALQGVTEQAKELDNAVDSVDGSGLDNFRNQLSEIQNASRVTVQDVINDIQKLKSLIDSTDLRLIDTSELGNVLQIEETLRQDLTTLNNRTFSIYDDFGGVAHAVDYFNLDKIKSIVLSTINEVGNATQEAVGDVKELGNAVDSVDGSGLEKVEESARDASGAIEKLTEDVKEASRIIDSIDDLDDRLSSVKNYNGSFDERVNGIGNLDDAAKELVGDMRNLDDIFNSINFNSIDSSGIDKLKDIVSNLKEEARLAMNYLQDGMWENMIAVSRNDMDSHDALNRLANENESFEQIGKLQERFSNIGHTLDNPEDYQEFFNRFGNSVDKANDSIQEATDNVKELDKTVDSVDSTEPEKVEQSLEEVGNVAQEAAGEVKELDNAVDGVDGSGLDSFKNKLSEIQNASRTTFQDVIGDIKKFNSLIDSTDLYSIDKSELREASRLSRTLERDFDALRNTDDYDYSYHDVRNDLINSKSSIGYAINDIRINQPLEEVDNTVKEVAENAERLDKIADGIDGSGIDKLEESANNAKDAIKEAADVVDKLDEKIDSTKSSSLDDIEQDVEELEGEFGLATTRVESFADALAKITSTRSGTQLRNIRVGLEHLGFDSKEIDKFLNDIKEVDGTIREITTVANDSGSITLTVKAKDDATGKLTTIVETVREIEREGKVELSISGYTKIVEKLDEVEKKANKIANSFTSVGKKVVSAKDSVKSLAKDNEDARAAAERLEAAYARLSEEIYKKNNAGKTIDGKLIEYDPQELIKASQDVEKELLHISNLTNDIQMQFGRLADPLKKLELKNKIELWLKENSAASEMFEAELRALQRELDNTTLSAHRYQEIMSRVENIKLEAKIEGVDGLNFLDAFKKKIKEYGTYFISSMSIYEVVEALRYMAQAVIEVDKAMTGLYRVTDLTSTQYDVLYDKMVDSAKEYGKTLTDTINATSEWIKAGYEDADTALRLAEITAMYQNISDLDYDTANDNLLTAINGFKDTLMAAYDNDITAAVGHITDVYNEIDNKFSVTSAGLGEGISRAASALQLAGNTFEESVAMIGAVTEVTQDPEKAGSAMKILSLRLRGMKGDLEEMGEEVDENVENISKMQGQVLNLTGGKVNIFDGMGNFRSTYDIMVDIASVYDRLSSTAQADLLETIAGKHRANDVAALIQNIGNAVDMVETANNAAGSAAEENAKYVDSLEGRINKLTAAFQAFSTTVLDTDTFKNVLSFLTGAVDIIEKIVDHLGTIGTIGAGVGIFQMFKRREGISNIIQDIASSFTVAEKGAQKFGKTTGGVFSKLKSSWSFGATAGAIGLFISAVGLATEAIRRHKEELALARQEDIEASNAFSDSYRSFEQVYIKYADKTVLTVDEENELKSAIDGTVKALGDKSGALKEAIGLSSEYATSLDKIAYAELREAQRLANDARNSAQEQLVAEAGEYQWFSSKANAASWILPKIDSTEYKAIQDIIEDPDFQEYVVDGNIRWNNGFESRSWFVFDDGDELDGIIEQYNYALEVKNRLLDEASKTGDNSILDSDTYRTASEAVALLSSGMEELIQQTYNYEKYSYQLKNGMITTVEEFYAMREAILSNATASVDARIAMANLMNDEYADIFDLTSVESRINYIQSVANGISDIGFDRINTFEMFLDMRTRVNNGECTVGEYTDYLQMANDAINSIEDADIREFLRVQLGLELDDDGNVDDEIRSLRDKLIRDLKNNNVSAEVAKAFTDGLNAAELQAAINLVASGEIDLQNFDIDSAMEEIEEEAQRIEDMRFSINIEAEVENIENIGTAVSESLSGTGLTEQSMVYVRNMFADIDGYDASKLFERTANGIRLNSDEFRRLNKEYKKSKIDSINKKMSALADEYLETKEELAGLVYGTEEYYAKARDLSDLEAQIQATDQLAAQYIGLASAYNEWQMAESVGSQRDMYESVISGFETVEDEISRGWFDDGTIEFIELLTGKDLSTASIGEVKEAWASVGKTIENTSYSVKDFFTTNEDGDSTNDGVYNFLDAVGQLEEEAFGGLDIVKRDEHGNIIGFDFKLAGGDDVIAEALGVSEELVQIMVRAADDAGFVVSMDGTYQQLDVLKEKAAEAALYLKDTLKVTDYSFFQDGSKEGILKDYNEAIKVWETFKANKNADGTVNMSVEGAEEAFALVSTLQSMVDRMNEPVYMDLKTSEVEKEMQTPLSKLQEYERLTQTEHQLKLKGTDTSEIDASQEEILDYFESLDPEVKAQLGIENLTREDLQEKIESGEIQIPATVDLQVEMNDTLKDMVNIALYNAGLIKRDQLETRVDLTLYAGEVDATDVGEKAEEAAESAADEAEHPAEARKHVVVTAGEVDASDVGKKAEEAAESAADEADTVETSVGFKTTVEELNELLSNLEEANKSIVIDVTVNGIDQVRELNRQIDLATSIEGNIDNLSVFVDGAKALSELDSVISTSVMASVSGNVIDTPEYKINNLKTFADSASGVKDIDNVASSVTANVYGNVIDEFEHRINNLKTYSESAVGVGDIGDVTSSVTADVYGNVITTLEEQIDNLKTYTDSAAGVKDIGTVTSSVTADVYGNVVNEWEENIDNLKTYSDNAAGVKDIGIVTSSVTADVYGNVVGTFEEQIDNLKTYTDNAAGVKDIGIVTSSVTADVGGNVITTFEEQIDNLKTYSDSAAGVGDIGNVTSNVSANITGNVVSLSDGSIDNLKTYSESAVGVGDIGDVTSSVTADVNGNVINEFEHRINNLKTYSESAVGVGDIGDVTSSVTADVNGNVITTLEEQIDNLKTYTDSAAGVGDIGDVTSSVTADVYGNVVNEWEENIDNLKTYTDSAAGVKDIGIVTSSVTADVNGNVITTLEEQIDNLKTYTDSASGVSDIGDVTSSVTADVNGNVITTLEEQIDNLKAYTDNAVGVADIGDITSSVTADINGNVTGMLEEQIDNLKVFSDSASDLSEIDDVTSKVTANLEGNVPWRLEEQIDNLTVFADGAVKLKDVGSFTSDVTANIYGNVDSDNVSKLESFNGIASATKAVGSVTVDVTANVATDDINNATTLLSTVSESGLFKDYSANVTVNATISDIDDTAVDEYNAPSKDGKVSYSVDPDSSVYNWSAPIKDGIVNYSASVDALTDEQKNKTGTITYRATVTGLVPSAISPIVGVGPVAGTAYPGGTALSGRAFARGNWGIKGSGVAIGGELGQELVVRDGRFFTVGDNGAEFFRYKPNDIVFNAAQTESLFKYGGIKGAKPRGTMLAGGTAFASGSAFPAGSEGYGGAGPSGTGSYHGNSSSSKSKSSSGNSAKEFLEIIDWIETAIDRIERSISKLDLKASSTFKKWITRNSALVDEISLVREELDLQTAAYNRYLQEANSVGLSEDYAQKVRDGKIDIESITDEGLKEQIDQYQEWYEKAIDCRDAIDELNENLAELQKQKFDNIITEFEGLLSIVEHEKSMLDEFVNQSEAQAWLVSEEYYKALADNQREVIATQKEERERLLAELNEAVASGRIEKGSETWVEMINSIDEVTLSITEGETALLEYAQTLQQLDWEVFDLEQAKISRITEEAEFLIDLLDSEKLYDDNGQLTDAGMSTMGLHGVGYNVNMAQADMAGAKAAELKKQLEEDPFDIKLEEQYYAMIQLQREHILAAQDEKEAIRDMVEEGINLELDALQELIDKRNEALDAEKEMYDYQKRVAEQTKEIASLEKQIAAYSGDDSEETRAKIQELKISYEEAKQELEETEYDKYISDQQTMMDELYLEYETILNERLDNLELLITEQVAAINANSATINTELQNKVGAVGTNLSEAMGTIWNTSDFSNTQNSIENSGNVVKDVITNYGDKFSEAQTTTNDALKFISTDIASMIKQLNVIAKTNTKTAAESSAAKSKEASGSNPVGGTGNTTTNKPTTTTPTTGDGTPKIGDKVKFVSGQYFYDSYGKSPLGSHYLGKEVYITNINKNGSHPYHISTGTKLGSGDLGWLKLNQLSGYATGKHNLLGNEFAWTQEDGQEYIIRPSDGAILTPIARGDSVLSAAASNNLWSMANDPAEFIKDNLGVTSIDSAIGTGGNANIEQNIGQVVFSLPNVKNYEQLLTEMQRDKNFERLVLSMTIDQVAGKSSLTKGKALR